MRDWTAVLHPLDQQEPAMHGQPGVTVGHEDLRCGVDLDTSTTSEVFLAHQTPTGVNNVRDQYT
jgi:hypothetical protein